ncbi:hypothetical protein RRG08_060308 [Elysia crispata]|uniref:Uncharacterized protein n=1 Tax=Elysia crispata TaxID=231223 RepID=A0AAE0Y2F4_9GAST|nr:hypothetical protein RRG08_060308 [Elysia crispata]
MMLVRCQLEFLLLQRFKPSCPLAKVSISSLAHTVAQLQLFATAVESTLKQTNIAIMFGRHVAVELERPL